MFYLSNPLPEAGLTEMLGNLETALRNQPRAVIVLYHNPLLEHVLASRASLKKLGGTHQYSIFAVGQAT